MVGRLFSSIAEREFKEVAEESQQEDQGEYFRCIVDHEKVNYLPNKDVPE